MTIKKRSSLKLSPHEDNIKNRLERLADRVLFHPECPSVSQDHA